MGTIPSDFGPFASLANLYVSFSLFSTAQSHFFVVQGPELQRAQWNSSRWHLAEQFGGVVRVSFVA